MDNNQMGEHFQRIKYERFEKMTIHELQVEFTELVEERSARLVHLLKKTGDRELKMLRLEKQLEYASIPFSLMSKRLRELEQTEQAIHLHIRVNNQIFSATTKEEAVQEALEEFDRAMQRLMQADTESSNPPPPAY